MAQNNTLASILMQHPQVASEIQQTLQVFSKMLLSHLQVIPTLRYLSKDNPLTQEEITYLQDHYCIMLEEFSPILNGTDAKDLTTFINQHCNY